MIARALGTALLVLTATHPLGAQDVAGSIARDRAERVDALLARLAEYGYAGAIAVARDGAVAHLAGHGLADRERGLPVRPTTGFDVGSLTKPFTAALVLWLVERGELAVDDTLGGLLEVVPEDKAGLTIHQLLTHTSGLVRSAASLGVDDDSPRGEFLASVLASELLFEPGTRYEYSDTGYDLLAAIVEIVTGETYAAQLRRAILEPAGLHHTGYAGDTRIDQSPVAPSYTAPIGVPWIETREGPSPASWTNIGSGGLVSTVEDLQRFARALWESRLLEPATVARMTAPHVRVDAAREYGYGWFVTDSPQGPLVYHGGDIAGYKAHLARYPDRGLVFAILDNVYGWERVTDRDAVAAWFGDGPELPPPVVGPGSDDASTSALSEVEGTYRTPWGDPVVVWIEAGRLAVEVEGQRTVDAIFAASGSETAARTRDARRLIEALRDDDRAFVASLLRERDRAAGMADRLVSIWGRLAERGGEARAFEVPGSYPAQDGTVVSLVEVVRDGGTDRVRLIWRGDRLVSAGGDEGLRRPTALFHPTGRSTAARYATASGTATRLMFAGDTLRIVSDGRETVAARDTARPIEPPRRSLVRTLLPTFLADGPEAGLARLDRLRRDEPGRYDFGEPALNDLGYRLLDADAVEAAIAVLRRNVAENPDSWNAHDSLGEAYLAAGRPEPARASYAASLALNPDNERARRVLEEGGS